MPALATRRPSPCLFCALAPALRPRPQHLPHIQTAHRTGGAAWKRGQEASQKPHLQLRYGKARETPREPYELFKDSRFTQQPDVFPSVRKQLEELRRQLETPAFLEGLRLTRAEFEEQWKRFSKQVQSWSRTRAPEMVTLAQAARRSNKMLALRLRYHFFASTYGERFTSAELENQKALADLRYPAEWYPATREIARTVHVHVGPTNSGKTYHALKRLEEVDSGIYLGPLRLLAHEVYTRLRAKGKPCALVTGEEQRIPEGVKPTMWSCTVEMAPLNTPLDVAVIDEIQMINHDERGWAWTQAYLGVRAHELHVCGEARAVPIIRQLAALCGDKVIVHEYERLTPLNVADRSLGGSLEKLEKGDCIVAFSVLGIHALRRLIEKKTGKKCAIVYGGLPPETRAQQARLFNEPDNDYDFLVASDAIGMGLNLSIKRVILETMMKSDGHQLVQLKTSEVKQIAGRAGRYRTAHQAIAQDSKETEASDASSDPVIGFDDAVPVVPKEPEKQTVGYVTTLEDFDFRFLKMRMSDEPAPIKTAGIFPPTTVIERFSNYFPPGTPFSYILLRLHEISNVHPRFHLCGLKDQLAIADIIQPIKNLNVQERLTICAAPVDTRDSAATAVLEELVRCIADNVSGSLLDIQSLPLETLDLEPSGKREYLYKLEQLHKMIVLYLWLSYRFPQVFTTRALATHAKQLVEDRIETTLSEFSFTELTRQKIMDKRKKAVESAIERQLRAAKKAGERGEEWEATVGEEGVVMPEEKKALFV
ncbi:P-loop containing nucleoside triphosphate hydrolase protein [Amniculicola lignicola CBS 123094]|uniref:RNA helicase n=1 Tax=Amniculicola lignicola CBS 123094 TaxID=1392246 RepID=A0A6A5W6R4_9PLEO|nr:P-loop containing nucleoside triphosphate hydrolase protein [Amniculicola lignicola CBS 123094]